MSEGLTCEDLRGRALSITVSKGMIYCIPCMSKWDIGQPESHRPGCPCDKGNVVISRATLSALWSMLHGIDHDCDLQRIHAEVTSALGEETAP